MAEELINAGVLPKDFNIKEHMKLVPIQKGDVPITYADTSALEKYFRYKPSTSLRDGLKQFVKWFYVFYYNS